MDHLKFISMSHVSTAGQRFPKIEVILSLNHLRLDSMRLDIWYLNQNAQTGRQ